MIIAADIETMLIENIHTPNAIGYYEGDNFRDICDPRCNPLLIFDFLKEILCKLINKRGQFMRKKAIHIYFHNLEFDGFFILDFLFNHNDLHEFIQSIDSSYHLDIKPILSLCSFFVNCKHPPKLLLLSFFNLLLLVSSKLRAKALRACEQRLKF
jgi:hypothetical protein